MGIFGGLFGALMGAVSGVFGFGMAEEEAAEEAEAEGFTEIAAQFRGVAAIEKLHEERYLKLLANVEGGIVFSRDGDMIWQCANCGHIHVGKQAPEVGPVCAHPQSYFQIKAQNY